MTPSSSDEIDVLQLLAKIYQFFLKNRLLVGLIMILCIGASFVSYKTTPKVYESRMIVYSAFITESYAKQLARDLQTMVLERDDQGLAAKLDIPVTDAASLQQIQADSHMDERTVAKEADKSTFMIIVQVTDKSVLPMLQDKVLQYFEKNEYVKVRVAEKKKYYQGMLEKVDQEVASLDKKDGSNLSRPVNVRDDRYLALKDQTIFDFDPATVRVILQRERLANEELLTLLKGAELVDGFGQPTRPAGPKLSIYLSAGIFSGIVIALSFLGLRALRDLSKKYSS